MAGKVCQPKTDDVLTTEPRRQPGKQCLLVSMEKYRGMHYGIKLGKGMMERSLFFFHLHP